MRSAGHRIEQDGIDPAEDRGVYADAEREHQHGGGGEPRLLSQHADAVADVLSDRLHHGVSARVLAPRAPSEIGFDDRLPDLPHIPLARETNTLTLAAHDEQFLEITGELFVRAARNKQFENRGSDSWRHIGSPSRPSRPL